MTAAFVWRQVPVDDAFITFRYAENLASGAGVVFNPGERVEGYSSLSWLLLLAGISALGLPVPLAAVALGTLCGVATLLLLAQRDGAAGQLAAVLTAVFLPFCYHLANGLETGLVALLVTVLTTATAATPARRWTLGIAAGLLPITRPEGLALLALWWLAWTVLVDESTRWRHLAAAIGGGVWLAQLAWRLAYFGDWMPNAARAKLLPPGLALPHGLRDLGAFAWAAGGWGVLLAAALVALWWAARGPATSADRRWPLAAAAFVVSAAGVLAVSGGDSFPLWRFFVPLVPTFFLLAARGLWDTASRPREVSLGKWLLAVAACAGLWQQHEPWLAAMAREGSWVHHWRQVGERLGELFPPQTTMALCPVGAIPYYSRLRAIDMLGLTEPRIARRPPDLRYWYPGHQRHDGPYVLSRHPDVVLLGNAPAVAQEQSFRWDQVRPYERDVAASERLRRDYRLWHLPMRDGTFVQLFVRTAMDPDTFVREAR